MFPGVYAKAEKATAFVGRYCDLDRAARWHKPALIAGTIGWATRWAIFAFLAYDVVSEASAAETVAMPDSGAQTALVWAIAIGTCMAIKWAGWTYGGVGYVHHRAKTRSPSA